MNKTQFLSPIKKNSKELTVVILGALSMYRNKGVGPTSLINIDGNPLCYRQMINIKSVYPLAEIFLTVGYYANQVINNKPDELRIIENQFYESSGHAEEIRLTTNASLNNKYLILNGNILPDRNSLLKMQGHGSCILVKNEVTDNIGSSNDSGKLQILSYGLKNRWCEIVFLQEEEVDIMKKFVYKRERGSYYLHEILNYIVNHGGNINVVKTDSNIEVISK